MNTDWIKPGAPIAYYQVTNDGDRYLTFSTVAKVATKSFTIEGFSERFRLADMGTRRIGGAWGYWYRAVHPDSQKAIEVGDGDERSRLRSRVWPLLANDSEDLVKVDAAIQALREWRTVLAAEVSQ